MNVNAPNSMEYNSIEAGSPVDIAKLFSDYFQSVFTPVDNLDYPNIPPFQSDQILHISVSYDNVIGVLKSTNVNKTCGPDNVPGAILRECATELSGPLIVLFNMSLNCGTFPTYFNRANVIPVCKKGDKRNVCNYRPISLLPLFSKVFEKLVYDSLYNHVHNTQYLT